MEHANVRVISGSLCWATCVKDMLELCHYIWVVQKDFRSTKVIQALLEPVLAHILHSTNGVIWDTTSSSPAQWHPFYLGTNVNSQCCEVNYNYCPKLPCIMVHIFQSHNLPFERVCVTRLLAIHVKKQEREREDLGEGTSEREVKHKWERIFSYRKTEFVPERQLAMAQVSCVVFYGLSSLADVMWHVARDSTVPVLLLRDVTSERSQAVPFAKSAGWIVYILPLTLLLAYIAIKAKPVSLNELEG